MTCLWPTWRHFNTFLLVPNFVYNIFICTQGYNITNTNVRIMHTSFWQRSFSIPEVQTPPICIWIAAKLRLGRLEFPQSVLDETTTFRQANSCVNGWQICHYWSPWLITNPNLLLWRLHNPYRHPTILCRLPPQTSGPWRLTSKGPHRPQLALCLASSSCKNNQ